MRKLKLAILGTTTLALLGAGTSTMAFAGTAQAPVRAPIRLGDTAFPRAGSCYNTFQVNVTDSGPDSSSHITFTHDADARCGRSYLSAVIAPHPGTLVTEGTGNLRIDASSTPLADQPVKGIYLIVCPEGSAWNGDQTGCAEFYVTVLY